MTHKDSVKPPGPDRSLSTPPTTSFNAMITLSILLALASPSTTVSDQPELTPNVTSIAAPAIVHELDGTYTMSAGGHDWEIEIEMTDAGTGGVGVVRKDGVAVIGETFAITIEDGKYRIVNLRFKKGEIRLNRAGDLETKMDYQENWKTWDRQ